MCSTDVYHSIFKPAAVAPKNTSPIISSFLELGRRKLSVSQNLWRRRKCCWQQKLASIRQWIARFYYFRHLYSAGSACIAHNNCMSCPSIWATLSFTLINILLGSFQLFLHSDQPLSEGEIIPFSGVCQLRGGCIIHAGGGGSFTHWLTDLWCATDDDQRASSRRASQL